VSERQIKRTVYFTPEQIRLLKALSAHTRVPQATYFREAIDDLLQKHKDKLQEIVGKKKSK